MRLGAIFLSVVLLSLVFSIQNSGAANLQSLTITESVDKIDVFQGDTVQTKIKVKNIGNATLPVNFSLADLSVNIPYTVAGSDSISSNTEEEFLLSFSISPDFKAGEYSGKFKIQSGSIFDTEDFIIVVSLNEQKKVSIKDSNQIYTMLLKTLKEKQPSVLCQLPDTNPVSKLDTKSKTQMASSLFKESDELLIKLDSALKDGDYLRSERHSDDLKQKTDTLSTIIKELEDYKTECTNIEKQNTSAMFFYSSIGTVILIFAGLLLYSYFPIRRGYHPEKGFSTAKPRPNLFAPVTKTFRKAGKLFKKEEEAIGLDKLEQAIAKEYSATANFVKKEVSYEFQQVSAWVRFKNKIGSIFSFGGSV